MHKILVIDDDEDILFAVELILKKAGFQVATSQITKGFFEIVEANKPHLILTDIFMGAYDGRKLCLTLKSNPAYQHLPVLLFSANFKAMENFEQYKADGFISKPFTIKELLSKIQSVLP